MEIYWGRHYWIVIDLENFLSSVPICVTTKSTYCEEAIGKQTSGEFSRHKQKNLKVHLTLWKMTSILFRPQCFKYTKCSYKIKNANTITHIVVLWFALICPSIFLSHLFSFFFRVISRALALGQSHVCQLPHVIDVLAVNLKDRAKCNSGPFD